HLLVFGFAVDGDEHFEGGFAAPEARIPVDIPAPDDAVRVGLALVAAVGDRGADIPSLHRLLDVVEGGRITSSIARHRESVGVPVNGQDTHMLGEATFRSFLGGENEILV